MEVLGIVVFLSLIFFILKGLINILKVISVFVLYVLYFLIEALSKAWASHKINKPFYRL